MITDDFEIVYETDKVMGDCLKCNHCGEKVDKGIFRISDHYDICKSKKNAPVIINGKTLIKLRL